MTLTDRLRQILQGEFDPHTEQQIISEILQAIYESLPKELDEDFGWLVREKHPDVDVDMDRDAPDAIIGYNQCLLEIKSILERK